MNITKELVANLYLATMGRTMASSGLDYWTNTGAYDGLNGNPVGTNITTMEGLSANFASQAEYATLYPAGTSDVDFVNQIFQNLFQRDAASTYWSDAIAAGETTRSEAVMSIISGAIGDDALILENRAAAAIDLAENSVLTTAVAQDAATTAALNAITSEVATIKTATDIIETKIATAAETAAIAAYDAALVTYTAAATAYDTAKTAADTAALTVTSVTEATASKTAADAANTAATALTTAATALTAAAAKTPSIIDDATAATNAATAATAATAAAALVTTATTALADATAAAEAAAAVGTTFTLTTGADTSFFGTAKSDTWNATQDTYNTGDLIVDSSTVDADTLNVTATSDIAATPTVVGVENINFNLDNFDAGGDAIFTVAANNISASKVNLDVVKTGSLLATGQINAVKDGMVVSFSDNFTTAGVQTAVDNDSVTINTAAKDASITVTAAAGTTDDVTIVGTNNTILAATANDGDLTMTVTGDLTVTDADAAAGAVSLTATGKLDIDGLEAAKTVTLKAAGVNDGTTDNSSNWTEGDNTAAVETLNLSGNGAALELVTANGDLTKLKAINISGDQDVEVSISAADIDANTALTTADKITVTDTSTGTSTINFNTVGSVDVSGISADVIEFSDDWDTDTIATGAAQTLTFSVDQTDSGTAPTINAVAASAATNTLTINLADDATAGTAVDAEFIINNVKTTTMNLQDTSARQTLTTINVGATNDLVVNATAYGVTLAGASTANKLTLNVTDKLDADTAVDGTNLKVLDASGSTTGITTTATATFNDITTGSGKDTITAAVQHLTVDGGDGTDILDFGTNDVTGKTYTISNIEILHADSGADFAGSLLDDESFTITDTTATTGITVVMDESTVNLSLLSVDTTKIANTNIDATTLAAAGSTLTIDGTNGVDTLDATGSTKVVTFTAGNGDDVVTITGSGNDVLDMGAGNDTVTDSGAGNDVITLGAGNDTVTDSGAGDDKITGGEGITLVYGNDGADTIDLTETDSAADIVRYSDQDEGSAIGVDAGTFTGFDVITGFEVGSDRLLFDTDTDFVTSSVTAWIAAGKNTVITKDDATTATNDLAEGDYTDVDSVVDFINDSATFTNATAATLELLAVTFDDSTAVYLIDSTDGTITAGEVQLLGTVDAVLTATELVIA